MRNHISRLAIKQSENYLIFDKKEFFFSFSQTFIFHHANCTHITLQNFIFALSNIRSTEILLQSHV